MLRKSFNILFCLKIIILDVLPEKSGSSDDSDMSLVKDDLVAYVCKYIFNPTFMSFFQFIYLCGLW